MFDGSTRLMLPLKHCVVLPPFQLQHHLRSCTYSFFIKDVVYHDLVMKYEKLHFVLLYLYFYLVIFGHGVLDTNIISI